MTVTATRLTPHFAARIDGVRHRRFMQRTTVAGDAAELATPAS